MLNWPINFSVLPYESQQGALLMLPSDSLSYCILRPIITIFTIKKNIIYWLFSWS